MTAEQKSREGQTRWFSGGMELSARGAQTLPAVRRDLTRLHLSTTQNHSTTMQHTTPMPSSSIAARHAAEIASGKRFEFGANWNRYLNTLTEEKIRLAEQSLIQRFGFEDLSGKSFLDIGCGSGVFSLAARRLGATVCSFDYDPQSVACARYLRTRYSAGDIHWRIEEGSALDKGFVTSLKQWDLVYSFGVLHHTGSMWEAIENCTTAVKPGGLFDIMLYRDAKLAPMWTRIKRTYSQGGPVVQSIMRYGFAGLQIAGLLAKGRNPARVIREYGSGSARGMSWFTDSTDWIGGYPFEYTEAEPMIAFMKERGFALVKISPEITPAGSGWKGTGSYQYLFKRSAS